MAVEYIAFNLLFEGLFAREASKKGLAEAFAGILRNRYKSWVRKDSFYMLTNRQDVNDEWVSFDLAKAFTKHDEVVNDSVGTIEEIEIPKKALKLSIIVNYEYNVILVQNKKKISVEKGIYTIADLLSQSYNDFGMPVAVRIKPWLVSRAFIKELDRFKNITYVNFYLHRPNPKYAETWAPILKELQNSNSEGMGITASSQEGLNLKNDNILKKALYMIEDGYGQGLAKGVDNNEKEEEVDSRNITKFILRIPSFNISDMAKRLARFSEQIRERFTK